MEWYVNTSPPLHRTDKIFNMGMGFLAISVPSFVFLCVFWPWSLYVEHAFPLESYFRVKIIVYSSTLLLRHLHSIACFFSFPGLWHTWGWCCFTAEDTGSERWCELPRVTQLLRGPAREWMGVFFSCRTALIIEIEPPPRMVKSSWEKYYCWDDTSLKWRHTAQVERSVPLEEPRGRNLLSWERTLKTSQQPFLLFPPAEE